MTDELTRLSIREAGTLLRQRQISATELAQAAIARIAAVDPLINAFVLATPDMAIKAAHLADRELAAGRDRGPMHGIPFAVKDVIDVIHLPTSCHSRLRLGHIADADAAVIERLKYGGGVMLGKVATHEFAIGGPSVDLPFPPARNPWNRDHVPGGSSSGSGAAVASGLVRVALGTDTGGSLRWPAAWCGVFGLKPTRGLVSRHGIFPLSPSLDHCGLIGWNADDIALALEVIAGHDRRDPTSVDRPVPDFAIEIGQDLHGLRIGWPRRSYADDDTASPQIIACLADAAKRLVALGARVEEIDLPDLDAMSVCARIIMAAESFKIHASDLKARPESFGERTYGYLIGGAALGASDVGRAMRLGAILSARLNDYLSDRYHAMLTPCVLSQPTRFEAYTPQSGPTVRLLTSPYNLSGNPALAVPGGFDSEGLPIGFQLVGRMFGEASLLRIGAAMEREREHRRPMPLFGDEEDVAKRTHRMVVSESPD